MRKTVDRLQSVVNAMGVMAFTSVFVAINLQVFMRYVVGSPVSWSEELPTIAFTVSVMWAGALMISASDHIVFELVADSIPEPARRFIIAIGSATVAAILLAALPAIIDFALYMKVLSSPILRVRYDFIFIFFAIFIAGTAIRAAIDALQRLRGVSSDPSSLATPREPPVA